MKAALDALSHPQRRAVLRALRDRGACRVGELADAVGLSGPALAWHLDVLEGAGLVDRDREGRAV